MPDYSNQMTIAGTLLEVPVVRPRGVTPRSETVVTPAPWAPSTLPFATGLLSGALALLTAVMAVTS